MKSATLMQRPPTVIIGSALLAAFILSGCGGGGNFDNPAYNPSSGSGNGGSTTNLFANTYMGKVALRDSSNQLTGNFAVINLVISANNQVNGTVIIQAGSTVADATIKHGQTAYSASAIKSHANANGTITVSGTANPQSGVLTATGSGSDNAGVLTTVTLNGTLEQLSATQLTTATVTTTTNGVTSSGMGTLPGTTRVIPSSNITLPILTGASKIPPGVTVKFAATGVDEPANPDHAETGDVVNFTIPDYHSPSFDGYSNIDSGGWAFTYDGTYFTVHVPLKAPITTGYEVRDRATGSPHSATFQVVPNPLQRYTAGTNFIGGAVWADVDFFPSLTAINTAAGTAGVKVFITNSFRATGQTLQGVIVPPADMSNHLVGHAIDMNVQYTDSSGVTHLANSSVLGQTTPPAPVAAFIAGVKAAGLRWGGDFLTPDVVHFDDNYNADAAQWQQKYGVIQQCVQSSGFTP